MIQVNIGRKDITLSFESPAFRCHNTFHANGRPNTRETRMTQRSATLCSLNRSSISHSLFMSLFVRWSGGSYPLSNLFVRETFTNWWVIRKDDRIIRIIGGQFVALSCLGDDVSREVRWGQSPAVGEVIVTMVTIYGKPMGEEAFVLSKPYCRGMERCNCFLPDYHLVRQRCWLDNVKAGMRQADIHKLWVSTSFRRQTVLFWIIIVDIHLTCRGDFREKGMGIARRHSSLPYNREIPRLLKRNENLLKEKNQSLPSIPQH